MDVKRFVIDPKKPSEVEDIRYQKSYRFFLDVLFRSRPIESSIGPKLNGMNTMTPKNGSHFIPRMINAATRSVEEDIKKGRFIYLLSARGV